MRSGFDNRDAPFTIQHLGAMASANVTDSLLREIKGLHGDIRVLHTELDSKLDARNSRIEALDSKLTQMLFFSAIFISVVLATLAYLLSQPWS